MKKIDYGFRLGNQPVLLHHDRSLPADESTHQMEKALRHMSMKYYVLDRCLQCGICSSFCPLTKLKTDDGFSPRIFIQKTRLGLLNLEKEDLWSCTNCGHCQMICPFEIRLPEIMADLRHLVMEQGAGYVPLSVKISVASIASCGNPWKEPPEARVQWLQNLGCSSTTSGPQDVHLYLGCMAGYDRRVRKTAEAALQILAQAQIPYQVLAEEEVCCGDTVQRVGDFSTAKATQEINRKNFIKHGVKTLYVFSPHCFSTFQKTLSSENITVAPLIELIHHLLTTNTFPEIKALPQKVTFHDPCFFSKHLNIVDLPRKILQNIPGIELVEMKHHGNKSLCCGGGGGGIWRDVKKGERLSELRLEEAMQTGAEAVVTSCPYCLSMLEDAKQGEEKYNGLEIIDIWEILVKGMKHENH